MKVIHWFRHGLRLHDNPSLLNAVKKCTGENASLINVYVLDPKVDLNPNKLSENRLWFLLETLRCLDDKLRDKGSKLFVCMGNPETVIPTLVKVNKAGFLTYERQTEPHNVARDRKIKDALQNESVEVEAVLGHTLFNPDHLLKLNGGKPTLNMTGFQTLVSKAGAPKKPKETPDSLPPFPKSIQSPGVKVFDDVPSLADFKDLGFDEKNKTCVINAGEDSAIKTMEAFLKQTNRVLSFEKPQTNPTSLEPDTTALSPFMSNGSLSCRLFYWKLMDVYAGAKKHSAPPVSLEGQLLWREMSHLIGYSTPNFGQMVGNPICRQIPWKEPAEDKEAKKMLDRWENGKIGFPAVDAVMNQLTTQGWMHHLARHLAACFLTRGDLWITWEAGAAVFEKHLLDADWNINNFSWHWLSCSAFFHQFFRCYSPIAFFKKTDPHGAFIRKHVPELAKMPDKFIYEPWLAPRATQEACKCIIGKDYPNPPFDHSVALKENLGKMKEAFAANKEAKSDGGPKAKKSRKG